MQSLARNGYTAEQVRAALHAPNRHIAFRYELLDTNNRFKRRLDNVLAASVSYNALAQIKRTARFTLEENGNINFLRDRIKPYARLRMPDGGWVEWPLGVFILSTPPRKATPEGWVVREVEAYDLLQVLVDDKVPDRYPITAGTNYIAAIKDLLTGAGLTALNLTPTDKALPTASDWEPGTSKLEIINGLLTAINYRALWVDENGVAVAEPYISPAEQAPAYTYQDDDQSVIFPEVQESLDLFAVPNRWVLVVSEPDRPPLVAVYTNDNSDSPTSTVNRGRVIVDFRQEQAADQETLDALAARLAFEASQVFEQVEVETAIMPMHSHADVIELYFAALGIRHKYSEVGWEFELKAGAHMRHKVRRVVSV